MARPEFHRLAERELNEAAGIEFSPLEFGDMVANGDENRLGTLDGRLIALLQRDAYRPNTDIARELKVGESTVRRRIQSLIRLGYLRIIGVTDPFDATMIGRAFSGPEHRAIRELSDDSSAKVLAVTMRRVWKSDDGILGDGTYLDLHDS